MAAILTEPTLEDAAAFIKAKGCTWCSPQEVLDAPASRHRVRAWVFAGPNIMAHHRRNNRFGGMGGALEMFSRLHSPEEAKENAGGYLRAARERRALGYGNCAELLKAAGIWRRRAMERQARFAERYQAGELLEAAE